MEWYGGGNVVCKNVALWRGRGRRVLNIMREACT